MCRSVSRSVYRIQLRVPRSWPKALARQAWLERRPAAFYIGKTAADRAGANHDPIGPAIRLAEHLGAIMDWPVSAFSGAPGLKLEWRHEVQQTIVS